MSFLQVNNPLRIPWSHHLLDVTLLVCFVVGVVWSVRAYRRDRPEYATLMMTGLIYGQVIELGGMIWHHSYTQGKFVVMLDYTVFPIFAHSTAMPVYVIILYPTLLFLAYKVVEAVGVTRRWQRAVVGGFVMALLDAPYAIQGGLSSVGWWTWRPWDLYQFWMTWPLVDLWWRLTWDALLLWAVYRLTPRIRSWYAEPGPASPAVHWKALLAVPAGIAVGANIVGPFLHLPVVIVTYLGGQQAPVVTALVLAMLAVVVFADKFPQRDVDLVALVGLGVYVLGMAILAVSTIVHEGRFTDYVLVEVVVFFALAVAAAYPPIMARRRERQNGLSQRRTEEYQADEGTPVAR